MPGLLFPIAGLLQAVPWFWYAVRMSKAGFPGWATLSCLAFGTALLAVSLWPLRRPRESTALRLVALYGASCAVLSLTSMFMGGALLELTSAASVGVALLGARWLRWQPELAREERGG